MILAPRYLPRLAATIGLFTRYGLADFARVQGLKEIAPEPGENGGDGVPSPERAAAFRKRLVELGPAYVKLGQVLSTRPDLLPEVYIRELERLQDDVGPIPFSDVVYTIERELGARLSKLFDWFDEAPIATASLGQVHAARLRDGRQVVVKVQRPDIRGQLADDVDFFRELARFLTAHTAAGSRIDMLGIIQQLERALADELDYRTEARNAASFRRSLAEFPRILIPRVIEAYTTEKVLTLERVRGVKIDAVSPLARLEYDFAPLADELTRAYLKQIIIDGHFHADPHPGNVFVVMPSTENPMTPSEVRSGERRSRPRKPVTPLSRLEAQAQQLAPPTPPDIDVRLSLIDFGMTARLSAELRERVVQLLMELAENRGDQAAETLVEVGDELPGFDRARFTRRVAALMARYYGLDIGEVQTGTVLYELINISYQEGLRLPAELTLLAKAFFNLDAVTRALDPSYSPMDTVREFGERVATDYARRELDPRNLLRLATEGGGLVNSLPHRLDVISARLAANEFQTRIEIPQIDELLSGLQKVATRVFSGLVLAGILVASAMLHEYRPVLGTWGFVLAGVIGLFMVLAIIWGDRKRPH